jgi:hypothetical protein
MHDTFDPLRPVPEFTLPVSVPVNLMVGVPSAGEGLSVRRFGFLISRLAHAVPQTAIRFTSDLRSDRLRIKSGVEKILNVIYVVLSIFMVSQ